MRIPLVSTKVYSAACLLLVLWLSCAQAGHKAGAASLQLDPGLAGIVTASQVPLIVIDRDPNLIWSVIGLEPDYAGMDDLVRKFLRSAHSSVVARLVLKSQGQTWLEELAPGHYWVTTDGLVSAGGERLLWSLPLTVDSLNTGSGELILHRSNAALVLGPEDTSF